MNNIKKHKRLIAAIVVILLAVLVEIFANRSAWGHAYDLDITDQRECRSGRISGYIFCSKRTLYSDAPCAGAF